MQLRRRLLPAALAAGLVVSALSAAAPAQAVTPLTRLRAVYAASESATWAGYSARVVPVTPAGDSNLVRYDRASNRTVLQHVRVGDPTTTTVLTSRYDYQRDPAAYGDALTLMGRSVWTYVRSPHNPFAFDDAATYARGLLTDLAPSRGATLVSVRYTRVGTYYTYRETVDLVRARVVARVVRGRVVQAWVTQLAPSGVDGVALSFRSARFGYGRQVIGVPTVFVTRASLDPPLEELGLRRALRFMVDDLVSTVDSASPAMTPADLYTYAVSKLPDYNRDTVAPYAITVTAVAGGVRLDQLGPFSHETVTRTVTIVGGKAQVG